LERITVRPEFPLMLLREYGFICGYAQMTGFHGSRKSVTLHNALHNFTVQTWLDVLIKIHAPIIDFTLSLI
jgi:hypothetical protein